MKCIGRLFRHFNDGIPEYDDYFAMKWAADRGDDMSYYNDYDVVIPKVEYARKALSRYNRCENPFSEEVVSLYDVAGEWLQLEFGPHIKDSRIRSNDSVEQHLKPDKSPGAPWTNVGILSKGEYFDKHAGFYAKYWDLLATPNYIRSLCSSSIKEELRTSEKVRLGTVRTIISMDVNHVKAHCMLTLDQNERLMGSIGKHSSCLGIVMQYGGWDELNTRMSAFGPLPSTGELDAKEFDSRFRKLCFDKIRDFRYFNLAEEFKTPANKMRMHNLYKELSNAPLVDVDGHVFSRDVGNPSGQACTTPDNIFKNFMDVVVLWHLIMPPSYHNYKDFKRYLIMCIVGDDINISVHPDIQHLFNMEKIFEHMSKIDMNYTTPSMKFRHNYECEFLSHGFVNILGKFLPIISCKRMRTSMLKFNVSGKISETILRACGLRTETFPCSHCREWFGDLITALRYEYGDSVDPEVVTAWKSYMTDADLWSLYTGLKYSDVCAVLASTEGAPEYKFARSLQSQIQNRNIPTQKVMSHQHTYGNHQAVQSIHAAARNALRESDSHPYSSFIRGAVRGLNPFSNASEGDRLAAVVSGAVAGGLPLAAYASNTEPLADDTSERERQEYIALYGNKRQRLDPIESTPAPPLVGVELNPGPDPPKWQKKLPKSEKKAIKAEIKSEVKALTKIAKPRDNPRGKWLPMGPRGGPRQQRVPRTSYGAKSLTLPRNNGSVLHPAKYVAQANAEAKHDSIELVENRDRYRKCIKDSWNNPLPPMGTSIEPIIPLSGIKNDSFALSALSAYDSLLFCVNASWKNCISIYKSSTGGNFVLHANVDAINIGGLTTVSLTQRVGIASMFVDYKNPPNGATVQAIMWAGVGSNTIDFLVENPASIFGLINSRLVPGKRATVVLKPSKLATIDTWANTPTATGPTTAEIRPFIMVHNYASVDKINYGVVVQGEGLQNTNQRLLYSSKHVADVSYEASHLMETMPVGLIATPTMPRMGNPLDSHISGDIGPQKKPLKWNWPDKVNGVEEKSFPLKLNNGLDVVYTETEIREKMKDAGFLALLPLDNLQWFKDHYSPEETPPKVIEPIHYYVTHHDNEDHCDNKHLDSDDDTVINRSDTKPKISDSTMDLAQALKGLVTSRSHLSH